MISFYKPFVCYIFNQKLPALNLRADFLPVAEGEHHTAVRIHRCVICKPVEQLLIYAALRDSV